MLDLVPFQGRSLCAWRQPVCVGLLGLENTGNSKAGYWDSLSVSPETLCQTIQPCQHKASAGGDAGPHLHFPCALCGEARSTFSFWGTRDSTELACSLLDLPHPPEILGWFGACPLPLGVLSLAFWGETGGFPIPVNFRKPFLHMQCLLSPGLRYQMVRDAEIGCMLNVPGGLQKLQENLIKR